MFTLVIIYAGVQNGIERVSKIMMPILVVLSVIIAIYSVTRPGAIEGVKYFLVPNVKNFSWMTVVGSHGTDVLFPVHRHGYPGNLWFLYEKRYLHRRFHKKRGNL